MQGKREVAQLIGQFYLKKNDMDYVAAEKEILALRISDLKVEGDKITIVTGRPGKILGKRASNIKELVEFLDKKFHIHIVEDTDSLLEWLVPQERDPDPMYYYEDHTHYYEDLG